MSGTVKNKGPRRCQNNDCARSEAEGIGHGFDITEACKFCLYTERNNSSNQLSLLRWMIETNSESLSIAELMPFYNQIKCASIQMNWVVPKSLWEIYTYFRILLQMYFSMLPTKSNLSEWTYNQTVKNIDASLAVGLTEEFEDYLRVLEQLVPSLFEGLVTIYKKTNSVEG